MPSKHFRRSRAVSPRLVLWGTMLQGAVERRGVSSRPRDSELDQLRATANAPLLAEETSLRKLSLGRGHGPRRLRAGPRAAGVPVSLAKPLRCLLICLVAPSPRCPAAAAALLRMLPSVLQNGLLLLK
jgi:hypothetical protein